MHSAIGQKKDLNVDVNADTCYPGHADSDQILVLLEKTAGFSPPDIYLKSSRLLSVFAPRAPPH